jgi:ribosomal protein S18 acetylase RimI-like enzyme
MHQLLATPIANCGRAAFLLTDIPFTVVADRDVAQLQIRILNDRDLPQIERHLLALDSISRRSRFGSVFADTSVVGYVRRIDLERALMVGAVDRTDGLVGLAEAQPTKSALQVEMAVSVHVPYRRRGLGGYLVTRAMTNAFARGAEVAEFLFARDNQASVGLVRSLGGHFTTLSRAEIRATNAQGNAA